uniref:DUF834 domain-containing protein n=1 Tax=Oryza punctata TaxID=4537 RepID=A0A0E0MNC2_ORYPU
MAQGKENEEAAAAPCTASWPWLDRWRRWRRSSTTACGCSSKRWCRQEVVEAKPMVQHEAPGQRGDGSRARRSWGGERKDDGAGRRGLSLGLYQWQQGHEKEAAMMAAQLPGSGDGSQRQRRSATNGDGAVAEAAAARKKKGEGRSESAIYRGEG